jgi:hypothetical protein
VFLILCNDASWAHRATLSALPARAGLRRSCTDAFADALFRVVTPALLPNFEKAGFADGHKSYQD